MIDKIWKNGKIISYEDARVGIDTHSLHYGSSVFEGIRAYKTLNGIGVLKLKEHMQRFLYSMNALGMQSKFSLEELCQAVLDMVKVNGNEIMLHKTFSLLWGRRCIGFAKGKSSCRYSYILFFYG